MVFINRKIMKVQVFFQILLLNNPLNNLDENNLVKTFEKKAFKLEVSKPKVVKSRFNNNPFKSFFIYKD